MQISLFPFFRPVILTASPRYTLSIKERVLNSLERYFVLKDTIGYEINIDKDADGKIIHQVSQDIITQDASLPWILLAVKIISYITVIVPLLILVAKFILRAICHKGAFDRMKIPVETHSWPYKKMPDVIFSDSVDPNTMDPVAVTNSLKNLCKALNQGQKPDGVVELGTDSSLIFFRMREYPGVCFKTVEDNFYPPISDVCEGSYNSPEIVQQYYNQTIQIKEHMDQNSYKYQHLYLPKSKLFKIVVEGKQHLFIAQEEIDGYDEESACVVWKNRDKELREAIGELASLVISTDQLNNVFSSKFIPFQDASRKWLLGLGNFRFTPLDTNYDSKVEEGIFSLIDSLYSQESMDLILKKMKKVASKQQLILLQMKMVQRGKQLTELYHFEQFCVDHGIDPYTYLSSIPIEDVMKGFEYDPAEKNALLNEIAVLEDGTKVNAKDATVAFMRCLNKLRTTPFWKPDVLKHHTFFDPTDLGEGVHPYLAQAHSQESSSDDLSHLWIRQILNELLEQKIICSWNVSSYVEDAEDDWSHELSIWWAE